MTKNKLLDEILRHKVEITRLEHLLEQKGVEVTTGWIIATVTACQEKVGGSFMLCSTVAVDTIVKTILNRLNIKINDEIDHDEEWKNVRDRYGGERDDQE